MRPCFQRLNDTRGGGHDLGLPSLAAHFFLAIVEPSTLKYRPRQLRGANERVQQHNMNLSEPPVTVTPLWTIGRGVQCDTAESRPV